MLTRLPAGTTPPSHGVVVRRTAALRGHPAGASGLGRSGPARGGPHLEHISDLNGCCRNGTLLLLAFAKVSRGQRRARLEQSYAVAREEEWAKFDADCRKYLAELYEGAASTPSPSSRRRSRASIGCAAGLAGCGAAVARPTRDVGLGCCTPARSSSRPTRITYRGSQRPPADHRGNPQAVDRLAGDDDVRPKDTLDGSLRSESSRRGSRPCRIGRRPAADVRDPGRYSAPAVVLTQGELSEDPHDFVAHYLLHTANGLTGTAVLFGVVCCCCTVPSRSS